MSRRYHFFKNTEIRLLHELAAAGKSQAYAATRLNRKPGSVSYAAIRYGIQFVARHGIVPMSPEERRLHRAESCRRYRERKFGLKPKSAKVTRFDDPRVMKPVS